MQEFTSAHYFAAHREAGEWARAYDDDLVPPSVIVGGFRWAGVDSAVYIALDSSKTVSYVGSVSRVEQQGLRERVREHLKSERGRTWVFMSIVPLLSGTPLTQVRNVEGYIARVLNPHSTYRTPKEH